MQAIDSSCARTERRTAGAHASAAAPQAAAERRLATAALGAALIVLAAAALADAQIQIKPQSPAPNPAPTAAPAEYDVVLFPAVAPYASTFPHRITPRGDILGSASNEAFEPLSAALLIDRTGVPQTLRSQNVVFNHALGGRRDLVVGRAGFRAVAWRSGVPQFLPVPGFFSGSALDANDQGMIVGSAGDMDFIGSKHCVWLNAATDVHILAEIIPGSPLGVATAINEQGQIVGTSGAEWGTFYAARWDGPFAAPLQIGPLPGAINSSGIDINAHGDVVGYSAYPDLATVEAFHFKASTGVLTPLGFLPAPGGGYSEAHGVNDEGWVVGAARAAPGVGHAVLWRDSGIVDLNDIAATGEILHLERAISINNRREIAAEAVVLVGDKQVRRIALLVPRQN